MPSRTQTWNEDSEAEFSAKIGTFSDAGRKIGRVRMQALYAKAWRLRTRAPKDVDPKWARAQKTRAKAKESVL